MAEKNSVQVLIGGKITTLSGYESEEYLNKVASCVNRKLREVGRSAGWKRMAAETRGTLLALNIADDLCKAREKADDLEEELQNRDRELYELRQQIVDLQVQLDKQKK